MNYLDALRLVHDVLEPRNYVEIGCRLGHSLSLARCPSIAIDPDFEIVTQIEAPVRLFKETSDDFFAAHDLRALLGAPLDLAFVDGMHLAEFALRDVLHLEQMAGPGSVILLDDVLPERIEWTTRERTTSAWTGDVFKVIPILREQRPDLAIEVFDVDMKGLAVISQVDPSRGLTPALLASFEVQAIDGYRELDSVAEIRAALGPRPVADLRPHLEELTTQRTSLATSSAHG